MPTVNLEDQEWAQLMALIANAPWRDANPLLMKIGAQLREQARPSGVQSAPPGGSVRLDLDGKEARHE